MIGTLTLADFLLARIAEDEARTRGWKRIDPLAEDPFGGVTYQDGRVYTRSGSDITDAYREWVNSLESADPDPRKLAECEAKRRIVELHAPHVSYPVGVVAEDGTVTDMPEGSFEAIVHTRRGCPVCAPIYSLEPCDTLRLLALPYAEHPDYRAEWRP